MHSTTIVNLFIIPILSVERERNVVSFTHIHIIYNDSFIRSIPPTHTVERTYENYSKKKKVRKSKKKRVAFARFHVVGEVLLECVPPA